jgi:nucleotide-binding universal stress UspA family protein
MGTRPVRTLVTLKSVAVAFDGEKPSVAALAEAVEVARKVGATLTLITVVPTMLGAIGVEVPPGSSPADAKAEAEGIVLREKERLEAAGIRGLTTVVLEGEPVDRVVDYCERHSVDLLVVGSRGLSTTGRFFLGSVSDGILHHAHCSVMVVKLPTPAHRST